MFGLGILDDSLQRGDLGIWMWGGEEMEKEGRGRGMGRWGEGEEWSSSWKLVGI